MGKKRVRARSGAPTIPVAEMKMCKLTKEGLTEEIAKRTAAPTAVCNRCRQQANAARDLCQPRVL